jgi:hypothetical protein
MKTTTKTIIISSVGTRKPGLTSYELDGKTTKTYYSSLALRNLLPNLSESVELWFVMTELAVELNWSTIQEEAAAGGFVCKKIDIVGDSDDVAEFLTETAKSLPEEASVILNITEGLRHHTFLYYALALYLTSFKKITIDGVWYCRYEIKPDGTPKPLIDLKSVFELADWFYGLRLEREIGSYHAIAAKSSSRRLRETLNELSKFIMNGLPLDAGGKASELCEQMNKDPLVAGIPFSEDLNCRLLATVGEYASDHHAIVKLLDQAELDRQARLIDRYIDRQQWNLAFGLMKEFIVNWIAIKECPNEWLKREQRTAIEKKLGLLNSITTKVRGNRRYQILYETMNEEQKEWARNWHKLTSMRNKLQHHGMNQASDRLNDESIRVLEIYWKRRESWNDSYQLAPGAGKLLICPLGRSPGVLYSALRRTNPDRVLVVTSADARGAVQEAIGRVTDADSSSDSPHLQVQELVMADPHGGVQEFAGLIEKSLPWLAECDEIHANLTGGTSLMGVLISQMVKEGLNLQKTVKEFVLIDKRSPLEQQSNPWELGTISYLL